MKVVLFIIWMLFQTYAHYVVYRTSVSSLSRYSDKTVIIIMYLITAIMFYHNYNAFGRHLDSGLMFKYEAVAQAVIAYNVGWKLAEALSK